MQFIDIYKQGYDRGYHHAIAGRNRMARWLLFLTSFLVWLPFVDKNSYFIGYTQGYHDGCIISKFG